jgi:hypothetical protein
LRENRPGFAGAWQVPSLAGTDVCQHGHGEVELNMPEPTIRDQIKHVLEELPPDATFEDAIERLVFLAKIDSGLAELDAGHGVPHDDVKRRFGM